MVWTIIISIYGIFYYKLLEVFSYGCKVGKELGRKNPNNTDIDTKRPFKCMTTLAYTFLLLCMNVGSCISYT